MAAATSTAKSTAKSTATKKAPAKKAAEPVVETTEGTWQHTVAESNKLLQRGTRATAKAGAMLWQGAQDGILTWLEDQAEDDVNGEALYNEVISLLGRSRKGDASKIKTVAIAAKDHGLTLASWPSLSKAYTEAKRLTVTVKQDEADDTAADEAISALAESAPASTKTPEGAALIVLKGGIDEAARLLLDALNGGVEADGEAVQNVAAHRALLRALSQEMKGREPKPAPKPVVAKKTAAPKSGAAKGKARPKPNPKADREVLAEGADPVDEADIPDVDVDVPDEPVEGEVDDMFDGIEDDEVSEDVTPEVPVKQVAAKPVKAKAKPVVRRA